MYMNDNAVFAQAEWQRSAEASVLDAPPDLLEFLPIAVFAYDSDGHLRWYNRHASEHTGLPRRTRLTQAAGG